MVTNLIRKHIECRGIESNEVPAIDEIKELLMTMKIEEKPKPLIKSTVTEKPKPKPKPKPEVKPQKQDIPVDDSDVDDFLDMILK